MKTVVPLLQSHSTPPWTWKFFNNNYKTLVTTPSLPLCFRHPAAHAISQSQDYSTKHTTLLVESFHEHKRLKSLLDNLKNNQNPLQLLQQDGDWSRDHFWAVIKFLKHSGRSNQILPVFHMWRDTEKTRINEFNYEKIVGLLGEEGLMEDAVSAFLEMKSFGLCLSLQVYNSIIHGYARNGKFDDALFYLKHMKEMNLRLESDTYDGLIEAYGKYRMYDEMGMCLKKMELDGCSPDRYTYNLLIQEFARGGLLTRMERIYQSMRTKRMKLQSSTLISMLEAYASFGIVEKMEKILRWTWNSKVTVKDELVRKLAGVYIANYMFSRLHDLAVDLTSRTGQTDIVWCLHLLSHACLSSRRGMDAVVREMEDSNACWNVTVANIILLACLKMKDFTRLRILFSRLPECRVEPDMVTFGILLDAEEIGFNGKEILEMWRKVGFLYRHVEMHTDPLVLSAFGKGRFLRSCEEAYSSLEPSAREKKRWTYINFINLVTKEKQREKQLQMNGS
ncbi:unnamed protein product [Dovyalis caffra]|uniref:Pentatricopeptide repeat-containing protein n=1 Tax=Dovyalis caffra TaxID=77055 RepID=A0AAV1SB00_9ROSI|nr:unnamed protein product [Dovyalis caffra]